MSEDNVEVVRRAFQAYQRQDGETLFALLHPEIVWHDRPETGRGSFHGHDGVVQFFAALAEVWEDVTYEAEEIIDAGDDVVLFLRQSARGAGSGVPVEERLAMVGRVEQGQLISIRVYTSREDALEAVGLRE